MRRKEYIDTGIKLCKRIVSIHNIPNINNHFEGRVNAQNIEKKWLSKFDRHFFMNGKKAILLKPKKNMRFWFDFAIKYKGEFFPCNFKSGRCTTKDNISGLKYVRYLLFYDLDSKYNLKKIEEEELAKKIIKLKKGEIKPNKTNREYFCISHCIKDNKVKVIPISCVRKNDLEINPKNLFQCNFHTAVFDADRSLNESVNMIIEKYKEYSTKRAESYLLFKKSKLL